RPAGRGRRRTGTGAAAARVRPHPVPGRRGVRAPPPVRLSVRPRAGLHLVLRGLPDPQGRRRGGPRGSARPGVADRAGAGRGTGRPRGQRTPADVNSCLSSSWSGAVRPVVTELCQVVTQTCPIWATNPY